MMIATGKIAVLIVDDEPAACDVLAFLLNNYPEIHLTGIAHSADEALTAIHKRCPDILFLDVQMPGKDGFYLVNKLKEFSLHPVIIFFTAHYEYTIPALRERAFDFLMKPIDELELRNAIARYKAMYRNGMPQTAENSGKPGTRLKIASRNGYQLPKYEQVVYCCSQRNYCKIHCTNGDRITASFTLKHIEQMLPYPQFIRISRSCIINTTFLEATEHKGCHYCILSYNGTKLKLRLSPEGEKLLLNMWMSL